MYIPCEHCGFDTEEDCKNCHLGILEKESTLTTIKVKEITLLETSTTDKLFLHTELPSACYPFDGSETLRLDAAHGTGRDYCVKNFLGVPVRVIKTGE